MSAPARSEEAARALRAEDDKFWFLLGLGLFGVCGAAGLFVYGSLGCTNSYYGYSSCGSVIALGMLAFMGGLVPLALAEGQRQKMRRMRFSPRCPGCGRPMDSARAGGLHWWTCRRCGTYLPPTQDSLPP